MGNLLIVNREDLGTKVWLQKKRSVEIDSVTSCSTPMTKPEEKPRTRHRVESRDCWKFWAGCTLYRWHSPQLFPASFKRHLTRLRQLYFWLGSTLKQSPHSSSLVSCIMQKGVKSSGQWREHTSWWLGRGPKRSS